MKVTLDRVMAVRSGAELLLTFTYHAPTPRTHTYRVSAEAYQTAGAPSEGETYDASEVMPLTEEEDAREAYKRAAKILASGDNTRMQLSRKLCERGFPAACAKQAVARLAEEGYIREDELLLRQLEIYAKRLWGPRKFMPSLLEKGFSHTDIQDALRVAKDTGVYDAERIKETLLASLPSADVSARRAWLYKHGF